MKTNRRRMRWVAAWLGLACLMLVLHSLTAEAEQPVKAVAAAEPQSPALPNRMTHDGRVQAVAYSPDGKMLASGSEDKTIKLWDVTTGKERATLKGHMQ